jgi:lipopolysaccharide biosynthesis protein
VKNALNILQALKINCIVSINQEADQTSIEYLIKNAMQVNVRVNFGRDFLAYKDGILRLNLKPIEKLLILNDSMIYFEKNLKSIFEEFFDSEVDLVSLYQNVGKKPHYQSMMLSFSSLILQDPSFIKFWKKYRGYDSRKYIIRSGEIKFSTRVLNHFTNVKVVCDFKDTDITPNLEKSYFVDYLKHEDREKIYKYKNYRKHKMNLFYDFLYKKRNSNPSHTFAFLSYFIHQSLILKRDVYYRESYGLDFIIYQLKKLKIDQDEIEKISFIYKNQKTMSQLPFFKKLLAYSGAI